MLNMIVAIDNITDADKIIMSNITKNLIKTQIYMISYLTNKNTENKYVRFKKI